MRLTPNVHVGLVLGIATAGVILALGGCVAGGGAGGHASAAPASGNARATVSADAADLEQFSESERERILAVQAIVERAAVENGVDPMLINAVIWVESRFEPKAKSPAGARGLMQLMPATAAYLAKRMGEHNPRSYDPEFNVRAGSLYLAEMIEKFGDEQQAVAAYHAGPGNVKRWLEAGEAFPDYSQAYVAKVMTARARFVGGGVHGRPSGTRGPSVVPERKHPPKGHAQDEPLVVPDVDSLPDAAQIHGVPRVVHVRPEPQPASEEPASEEPVFEVHPELDAAPNAAPPGWRAPPREREPKREQTRKPEPKPAPGPKPEQPTDEQDEPVGIGVLPDL